MRISDWSSDVCSSDLLVKFDFLGLKTTTIINAAVQHVRASSPELANLDILDIPFEDPAILEMLNAGYCHGIFQLESEGMVKALKQVRPRSEEHTSELQSLMRISYAVFCLKKKNKTKHKH